MKIIKQALFILMALFLLYFSFTTVRQIVVFGPEKLSLGESFFLGFLINLCVTGIFAFPGFVFPTSKLLPDNYYTIKNSSKLMRLYSILGVKYFQKLLLLFFWGKKANRKKFFDGTKNGLERFSYQSKQSEFGHLGPLFVILLVAILMAFSSYYLLVFFIVVINIIGNLYPVILQRYHRIRIGKILST
ncbi:glycosyl-4,4'-diaponeurosporenoate acyltransferase CrtO family protein [Cyclobacterium amurskyense]|uniref:Glycosyl-4,4'-diaponeurosporenoate acyltransferase n=1 Tax=Cyclobacterium amurskyense TaxID=320787 RepID=A0A0H4PEC1_9BACT|nr:hypothetical protein [Cyclobacterium amurskyense]AKP51158.1 hypothetical protein CA2015_1725 [Cyclobacterium amurskyense]